MLTFKQNYSGFTIVELLIVIVIIAILATISIVAYNGIQDRANDAAIQSDLKNMGQKFLAFQATDGRLPNTSTDYNSMGLKVSRKAYGNGYQSDKYNMAYCYNTLTAGDFAIVAASKSGNVYKFKDGAVTEGTGPMQSIVTTCVNNGVANAVNAAAYWFYNNSTWQAWIGS